jgi:hypothetical protein
MIRSTAFEAAVVGGLAALASFCALHASGEEPYSVVAQSTKATAGTARRPLSSRIASSRLPSRPVPAAAAVAEPEGSPPSTTEASREATLQRVRQVLARKPLDTAPAAQSSFVVGEPSTPAADEPVAPATDEPLPLATDTPSLPVAPAGVALATVAAEPAARLEFDVRESRVFLTEGERVIMNIAVRNIGPTTARRVETALFFADGVEPVKTTGHGAAITAGEVRLEPIDSLAPGDSVVLAVTAVGVRPGSVVYRGELACAELPGVLAREGALRVDPRDADQVTGGGESGSATRAPQP